MSDYREMWRERDDRRRLNKLANSSLCNGCGRRTWRTDATCYHCGTKNPINQGEPA